MAFASKQRHRDDITPVLRELHWLPVRRRIALLLVMAVWRNTSAKVSTSEVDLRRSRLVLGWPTSPQLSLAISSWVGAMSSSVSWESNRI